MSHPYEHTFRILLQSTDVTGINPFKRIRRHFFLGLLMLCTILVLVVLRFKYEESDFKNLTITLDSLITTVHLIIKALLLLQRRPQIKELLQIIQTSFSDFTNINPDFAKLTAQRFNTLHKCLRALQTWTVTASIIFFFRPFLIDNHLPMPCYVPYGIPYHVFAVYNGIVFAFGASAVILFDMTIFALIISLYIQFTILNERILMIKWQDSDLVDVLKELNACARFQDVLHKYLKKLNATISIMCLTHYVIVTMSMCFQLFLLARAPNMAETLKIVTFIVGLAVVQMFCVYSFPCSLLSSESDKTLLNLYKTDWFNCRNYSARKNLVIMMQNSQKTAQITAGNMFYMNLDACTAAYKTSMSFYTCLQVVGEK